MILKFEVIQNCRSVLKLKEINNMLRKNFDIIIQSNKANIAKLVYYKSNHKTDYAECLNWLKYSKITITLT